jgi:PTS system N-acetylglucosamine-specific IIC component
MGMSSDRRRRETAASASGLMAGALYNRFKDIKLPEYLAFFGGRRFVPIVTGFSAVALGVIFGLIWPPVQQGINSFGVLLMESGSFGAFVFGVFNRLLIHVRIPYSGDPPAMLDEAYS